MHNVQSGTLVSIQLSHLPSKSVLAMWTQTQSAAFQTSKTRRGQRKQIPACMNQGNIFIVTFHQMFTTTRIQHLHVFNCASFSSHTGTVKRKTLSDGTCRSNTHRHGNDVKLQQVLINWSVTPTQCCMESRRKIFIAFSECRTPSHESFSVLRRLSSATLPICCVTALVSCSVTYTV